MKALIDSAGAQLIRRRFADISELMPAVYASLIDYLVVKELVRVGPFDAAACTNATLDDINLDKVIKFVELARRMLGIGIESVDLLHTGAIQLPQ